MPSNAYRRVVEIGGVPVLLEASDADRGSVVAAWLDGVPDSNEAAVVSVRYERRPPPLPSRSPDRTYLDMRVWCEADVVVLQYADDTRAHVAGGEAHIGGGEPGIAFARLFHPAIAHLLAPRGRFVLHAAAIARRGAALLVLGLTGSGKSTVALAALEDGWDVLGDDLAVVRLGAAGIDVTGVARRTALPGDLGAAAQREGLALPEDGRGRWMLAPDRLIPGWFPVAGAVLPTHSTEQGGSVERCGSEHVFDTALASFAPIADGRRLRQVFPCAAAIARLPAWELGLGREPATRLASTARLLREIDAAARSRS